MLTALEAAAEYRGHLRERNLYPAAVCPSAAELHQRTEFP